MVRFLIPLSIVLYTIVGISGFVVSPESVALQTAALGSKLADVRDSAVEVTHVVGEAIQDKVNTVVDTVNTASATATAAVNERLLRAQHAVSGFVDSTNKAVQGAVVTSQQAVNNAVVATQHAVDQTVHRTSDVLQKATDVVLTPVRLVSNHVSDKFVLISNRLYQMIFPNESEVVYVPVSSATYTSSGVVVPPNHHVTYTEVVHPYQYKSVGDDVLVVAGSENVETIVSDDDVKETPEEGKLLHEETSPKGRLDDMPTIYHENQQNIVVRRKRIVQGENYQQFFR